LRRVIGDFASPQPCGFAAPCSCEQEHFVLAGEPSGLGGEGRVACGVIGPLGRI